MPVPDLLSNSNVETKPDTKSPEDVLDFFKLPGKDDKEDNKDDKEDDDKVKSKDNKDDKLADDDDDIELKEPDEDADKLNLDDKKDEGEIETPPRKREVLAKYPNLFKEFPFFEKLMYRDRQYTELFGSFDDAKEIAEKAQNLDGFVNDLLKGNVETTLNSVKDADKKAFDKIVDNYLGTLYKVDKEAYLEVVGNVGKQFISQMANEARKIGNKELMDAAVIVNQFLFGTVEYTPPKPRTTADSSKDKEIQDERSQLIQERFESTRVELETKIDNTLRATIADHIDPKGEMSPYARKNAIRDALHGLHNTIASDSAFRKSLDRMWEAAFSDRFSQNSMNRIRSAYLGRSKQSLRTIINKARSEALKDAPSRHVKDDDDDIDNSKSNSDRNSSQRRGPISPGRPAQRSDKLQMKKGESVSEFLARD